MPIARPARHLLEGSRSVANGEELAQAIRDKVEDIRITDHIDLSALPQATGAEEDTARGSKTLPDVTSPTSSIRVCVPTLCGDC